MAIIKCKMCGGDLNIEEGASVAECEYCGSRQTVPNQDSEKKLTLFGRANRLRLACEFDKAAGVYESIVADFPEEAEAYWGLVLCRYGIEYVDDPRTGKKIPTCHRSSFDSVMEDQDFEQACENADAVARKVYREEAKAIEELRRGILEVSGKEAPYDVFICYKETDDNGDRTIDSVIAQDVYDSLTEKGYRVFFSRISLEDKLGTEYEPYIFAALNSAKIMLVFGTDYEYFNAVWVKNEWSRFLALIAGGQKKVLIPCYKNVDAYDMPKEFARLQAQDMGKVGAIQDLLRGIEKILPKGNHSGIKIVEERQENSGNKAFMKRGYMALEDGEWERADGFFEEVLNLDPENSQAYLGKALAEYKCRTLKELSLLIQKDITFTEIELKLEPDKEHIDSVVKKYIGQPYWMSETYVREMYNKFDLRYTVCIEDTSNIRKKLEEKWNNNRLIARAIRFSDGLPKDEIDAEMERSFQQLCKKMEMAKEKNKSNLRELEDRYRTFLEDTDNKLNEIAAASTARLELKYQSALYYCERATCVENFMAAIERFETLGDYRDSKERIKYCQDAIAGLKGGK